MRLRCKQGMVEHSIDLILCISCLCRLTASSSALPAVSSSFSSPPSPLYLCDIRCNGGALPSSPAPFPLSRLRSRCSFGAALPSGVSTRALQNHYPKLSLRSTRPPRSARAGRRLRLRSVSPLIQTWKEGHLAEAPAWKSGNVGTVTRLGGFPRPSHYCNESGHLGLPQD